MNLIAEWKQSWNLTSVQAAALGGAMDTVVILLTIWGDRLTTDNVMVYAGVRFAVSVLTVILRLIKQKAVNSVTD